MVNLENGDGQPHTEDQPQGKKAMGGITSVWPQMIFMSLVFFCCPGIFNAMNSIGLGGDPAKGRIANLGIYICFTLSSFLGPAIVNTLGPKWALFLGATGYPPISIALNGKFDLPDYAVGLIGVYLGFCAGFLFTAQGQLMMAYPRDGEKGKFITIFWSIFNAGSVIGTFMAFGVNYETKKDGPQPTPSTISLTTYWIFFALMCGGMLSALFVLPIRLVTRNGYRIVQESDEQKRKSQADATKSSWQLIVAELGYTFKAFTSGSILCFIPLFFYTNYFNSYRFGAIGLLFNGRTGALAAALYWIFQILASYAMQLFTDSKKLSARTRVKWSFPLVFTYLCISWALMGCIQYLYKLSYDPSKAPHMDLTSVKPDQYPKQYDTYTDGKLDGGKVWIYMNAPAFAIAVIAISGAADAFVQVWSYWIMGMMSKDPEVLARYAGFFKFWQNLGVTISFVLSIAPEIAEVDYWCNVGIILAFFVPTMFGIKKVLKQMKEEDENENKRDSTASESMYA